MRPAQKKMLPIVGYFRMMGSLPAAIIGSCIICMTKRYIRNFLLTTACSNGKRGGGEGTMNEHPSGTKVSQKLHLEGRCKAPNPCEEQPGHFYTAEPTMTSSCTQALSRKVTNDA